MKNEKTITVVIASCKYGHFAAHCIESILSQTVQPDEIFFVDDGVGDCSHLPKIYPKIKYVFTKLKKILLKEINVIWRFFLTKKKKF